MESASETEDLFSYLPNVDMQQIFPFLTALWLSTVSAQFAAIGKGIAKEVAAVKDPIEKTVVSVGFSQCENVKKLIGVDYEQYKDKDQEPDLTKLTLDFITSGYRVTYNISAAPELIPRASWLDPHRPLIIYLHGFTDDPTKDSYKNISNAFLEKGDYNIIALDASSLIHWLYLRSTTMVRFIGQKVGEVLAAMTKVGMNPAGIHLVGHSLGSHISGFTGKAYHNLTGKKVGRISGLDPAGPCFSDLESGLRLSKHDADFVDIIHTDAGVYGLDEPIGHVDFWPNSGSEQPNCLFQTCSHSRAWLLYAESVLNPKAFPAVTCKDWKSFKSGKCDYNKVAYMGYGCSADTRGSYYLQTGEDPPYARGKAGLHFKNNDGVVKNVGSIITSIF